MSKKTTNGKPSNLLPVPAFDADLLPDALRPWVADIADRMQCPLDFPAVGAMIVLAAVVGRKVGIRPKMRDAWQVIVNLWGLLIGRPGIMKSPPLKEVLKPLHRLEALAKKEYADAMQEYATRAIVAVARKKVTQTEIEKAVKRGDADPDKMAADLLAEDEQPPTRRRYIVNDSTVEKMGIIFNENPNGLLGYRDEIQGLLRGLDKPGREDYRTFYLECWAGDGRFTWDRVGRGTLDIEACCLSFIGTIQPGPLQSYQFSAAAGGQGDDGLLHAFNWRCGQTCQAIGSTSMSGLTRKHATAPMRWWNGLRTSTRGTWTPNRMTTMRFPFFDSTTRRKARSMSGGATLNGLCGRVRWPRRWNQSTQSTGA